MTTEITPLTAEETETATNALTRDRSGTTPQELAASFVAYRQETAQLELRFRAYLEETYAGPELQNVLDELYQRAVELGNGSGYFDIEHHYGEAAAFAERILAAVR